MNHDQPLMVLVRGTRPALTCLTKFPTYEHSIITAPRGGQGQKRGGRQEWYATEAALFHMHTKRLKCK
jgi:hypothetical protein